MSKVIKFPVREKWNGKGLKGKHLLQLSKDIKHQAAVDEAKKLVTRLEHKLDISETKLVGLKAELRKAKTDYFKLLEVSED
jgi:multidrug resistance efflux pump